MGSCIDKPKCGWIIAPFNGHPNNTSKESHIAAVAGILPSSQDRHICIWEVCRMLSLSFRTVQIILHKELHLRNWPWNGYSINWPMSYSSILSRMDLNMWQMSSQKMRPGCHSSASQEQGRAWSSDQTLSLLDIISEQEDDVTETSSQSLSRRMCQLMLCLLTACTITGSSHAEPVLLRAVQEMSS